MRHKPTYGSNNHIQDSSEIGSLYEALLTMRPKGKYGAYYLVATYRSSSSASATLNSINTGKRRVPKGDWDFKVTVHKDAGRSYLYARRIA